MTALIQLGIAGFIIQAAGILCYLGIVHTAFDDPGKQITIGVYCVVIVGLFVAAVRQLSFKELVVLAVVLTMVFTAIYEVLGFAVFPGLVKDTVLFSRDHLEGLVAGAALLFAGYMGGLLIVLGLSKLWKTTTSRPGRKTRA